MQPEMRMPLRVSDFDIAAHDVAQTPRDPLDELGLLSL